MNIIIIRKGRVVPPNNGIFFAYRVAPSHYIILLRIV